MAVLHFERKRCDRCGASAEMPRDNILRGWIVVGFPNTGGGFSGESGMPPKFDLCPDCRGELVAWWQERRTQ
jgi:uncharacterized protein with PIN domain